MSNQPTEYRYPCENCGAALRFAPGQQVLTCDYCGHVQKIGPGPARAPGLEPESKSEREARPGDEAATSAVPRIGRALQWDASHKAPHLREIPLADGLRLDADSDLAVTVRQVSCPNCGAKVEVDSDRHATECPFCATPVVTDTGTARQIKPQGVLPFVVTESEARDALGKWMKGLWFAPNGLARYARKGRRMSGIYSPFWTFDADTRTVYHGLRGDHYFETVWVTEEINGRRQRVARQVMKTRWTPASGQVERAFDDVLISATTSLPRSFTTALIPWDLSQLAEYQPAYLAGFGAEGYTVPLADGHDTARAEMAMVIAGDVRRDIGGDVQQILNMQTGHENETFKHILLPIWTAAYRYGGRSYRFVVNGQSGRVHGERPWSAWKIAVAVLLVLLIGLALLLLANDEGYIQLSQGMSAGGHGLPAPAAAMLRQG